MESESADVLGPVFFFKPKYRLSHPENYLISLSNKKFKDQSIQKTCYLILKKEARLGSQLSSRITELHDDYWYKK